MASKIKTKLIAKSGIAATVPSWKSVILRYTDFSTAGLTNNITCYTLIPGEFIHDIKIVPTEDFAGGLIATYTISIGIAGSLLKYSTANNVFTGNTTTTTVHTPIAGFESLVSSIELKASAISTVGNLNAATNGAITLYLLTSTLQ